MSYVELFESLEAEEQEIILESFSEYIQDIFEEAENQLNEISVETKKSYIKKAVDSVKDMSNRANNALSSANDIRAVKSGLSKKSEKYNKLTNRENEFVNLTAKLASKVRNREGKINKALINISPDDSFPETNAFNISNNASAVKDSLATARATKNPRDIKNAKRAVDVMRDMHQALKRDTESK